MTKQKKLFSIKNKDNQMDMNADEQICNHFQYGQHMLSLTCQCVRGS